MAPLDLRPLIEALTSLVQVSAIARYPHQFDAVEGSQGATELAKQGQFAGPWSGEPLTEVISMANMLVFSAEQNLRSAATLIASGSLYGPFTLARSAFETSAQAWWVFDSAIGIEERLCRGGNFILNSHYERRKLENEIGLTETRTLKINAIFDTARQTGLPFAPSGQLPPRWLGTGWKDATLLCRQLWQDPSDPDSTVGAVVYRYLSATPHGTLHGIMRNAKLVGGFPAGSTGTMAAQVVNPSEMATLLASVLVAYIIAADRQMTYFGWDGPAWEAWKKAATEKVRPRLPGRVPL